MSNNIFIIMSKTEQCVCTGQLRQNTRDIPNDTRLYICSTRVSCESLKTVMTTFSPHDDEGYGIVDHTQTNACMWSVAPVCGPPASDARGVYTPVSTTTPLYYMKCPNSSPGLYIKSIVPIALGMLVLGTWMENSVLILVSGGLCFLSAVLCLPFSTIAVILFVVAYIWIGFGSKAYYIITHVAANNSSSVLKRIIHPLLDSAHPSESQS